MTRDRMGMNENIDLLLYDKVCETMGRVARACGCRPNWVVTHPAITDLCPASIDRLKKEFAFYNSNLLAVTDILVGYRGSILESGYVYCPYIPMGLHHTKYKKSGGTKIVVRYGKKLTPAGANYYGAIDIA
jgi:hypothetical protein